RPPPGRWSRSKAQRGRTHPPQRVHGGARSRPRMLPAITARGGGAWETPPPRVLPARRCLPNRERAGHAFGLVSVERAVELVLAGLEVDRQGRGVAGLHDGPVLVDSVA